MCGQGILRCECGIVNWKYVTMEVVMLYFYIADVVCGKGILRCKCGIVNWQYVTVGVGRL